MLNEVFYNGNMFRAVVRPSKSFFLGRSRWRVVVERSPAALELEQVGPVEYEYVTRSRGEWRHHRKLGAFKRRADANDEAHAYLDYLKIAEAARDKGYSGLIR